MADEPAPPQPLLQSDAGTGAVDTTNANLRNQQLSAVISALSEGSTVNAELLTDIANAIASDIIGGSTGTTANRVLVAKGTTGRALQAAPNLMDPSTGDTQFAAGAGLRTGTSAGNTLLFQARDVDGSAWTTFATLTANNTPTFDLAAATTKGGAGIAIVTQLETGQWLIPFLDDGDYRVVINIPYGLTITSCTSRCTTGTATATFKINTTALGGTANAVSTSEQTQSHSSANVMVAGDDLVITVSSSATCENASLSFSATRTLS